MVHLLQFILILENNRISMTPHFIQNIQYTYVNQNNCIHTYSHIGTRKREQQNNEGGGKYVGSVFGKIIRACYHSIKLIIYESRLCDGWRHRRQCIV